MTHRSSPSRVQDFRSPTRSSPPFASTRRDVAARRARHAREAPPVLWQQRHSGLELLRWGRVPRLQRSAANYIKGTVMKIRAFVIVAALATPVLANADDTTPKDKPTTGDKTT